MKKLIVILALLFISCNSDKEITQPIIYRDVKVTLSTNCTIGFGACTWVSTGDDICTQPILKEYSIMYPGNYEYSGRMKQGSKINMTLVNDIQGGIVTVVMYIDNEEVWQITNTGTWARYIQDID